MPLPRSCLLLALLAACAADPDTSARGTPVIGGSPSSPGEFPAVGALHAGGPFCTGTLIRPDVVLTAAHCLDFGGGGVPGFTLDDDALSSPTVVDGDHLVIHPMYGTEPEIHALGQFWDIGILWLAQPIDGVQPLDMATPAEAATFTEGMEVAIVGYGATDAQGGGGGTKEDAITHVIAWNDSEVQIGDGSDPQNCYGDSGGPAIADFGNGLRTFGVVSRGASEPEDCEHGGIDTRVDYYRDWVLDQLGEVDSPDAGVGPDASTGADAGDPAVDGGDAGCCSSGGDRAAGSALLALAILGTGRRRRRE
jgi:MYXO-CTERM domain-containing protein